MHCPPNLRLLNLTQRFNQPLDGLRLPQSLTHLILVGAFHHSVQPLSLLPNLRRLELTYGFDQPLSGVDWTLPALHELHFQPSSRGDDGLRETPLRSLPASLRELHLFVSPLDGDIGLDLRDALVRMLESGELRASLKQRLLPCELIGLGGPRHYWQAEDRPPGHAPLPLPEGITRLLFGERPTDGDAGGRPPLLDFTWLPSA